MSNWSPLLFARDLVGKRLVLFHIPISLTKRQFSIEPEKKGKNPTDSPNLGMYAFTEQLQTDNPATEECREEAS